MFSRKIKLNSTKVLKSIEELVSKVPGNILYMLRYEKAEVKILKKNLKKLEISLREFLKYLSDEHVMRYSLSMRKEFSLFDPMFLLYKSKKRNLWVIKVYPGLSNDLTRIHDLSLLKEFKKDFRFFQNDQFKEFEELDATAYALAISKEDRTLYRVKNSMKIVIQYIPVEKKPANNTEN